MVRRRSRWCYGRRRPWLPVQRVLQNRCDAAVAAHEAAIDVARTAIESTQEARETIEEARREAIDKLRNKGIDTTATEKSFEELIAGAKEREQGAKDALKSIKKLRDRDVSANIDLGKGLKNYLKNQSQEG